MDEIDKTMELCSKALADIFEECAKKYEDAIEAENSIHERTIEVLKSRAASCRVHGEESRAWLDDRAKSARGAISSATSTIESLMPKPLDPEKEPSE